RRQCLRAQVVRRDARVLRFSLARRDLHHPAEGDAHRREPVLREPGVRARQAPRHAVPRRDDARADRRLVRRLGKGAHSEGRAVGANSGADVRAARRARAFAQRDRRRPLRALDRRTESLERYLMPKAKAGKGTPRPASGPVTLFVGTRKGAFFIRSDRARRSWTLAGPHFLGNIVNHLVLDPRDGKTLLCAVRAGHLGPTVFRSTDFGRTWKEAQRPPDGATLHSINVDPRDPGHLYIGISVGGAFESTDGGASWRPLNKGVAADFLPVKDPEYGHDVHCMRLHPLAPDRLYQQNH